MKLSKEDFPEDKKVPLKVKAKCFCLELDSTKMSLEYSIFSTDYYKQGFEEAEIEEVDIYYYGDKHGNPAIGLEYGEYDEKFLCGGEDIYNYVESEDVYHAWSFVCDITDYYDCLKVYELVNLIDQVDSISLARDEPDDSDYDSNENMDNLVIEI